MNAVGQAWLVANQKKFTPQHLANIRSKMEQMSDDQITALSAAPLKDPTIMLVIEVLVGELGIHRFMLGDTGMGVLELLTGGLCGILWLVDMFTIVNKTKEYNYNQLLPFL